jgi:hypothetical protein
MQDGLKIKLFACTPSVHQPIFTLQTAAGCAQVCRAWRVWHGASTLPATKACKVSAVLIQVVPDWR